MDPSLSSWTPSFSSSVSHSLPLSRDFSLAWVLRGGVGKVLLFCPSVGYSSSKNRNFSALDVWFVDDVVLALLTISAVTSLIFVSLAPWSATLLSSSFWRFLASLAFRLLCLRNSLLASSSASVSSSSSLSLCFVPFFSTVFQFSSLLPNNNEYSNFLNKIHIFQWKSNYHQIFPLLFVEEVF